MISYTDVFARVIKEQSKSVCLSPPDCKEIRVNPSYTSVLNRNCFVTLGAVIR